MILFLVTLIKVVWILKGLHLFFSHFLIDYVLKCLMNYIKHVAALIVRYDCVLIMLFLKPFYLGAM
jgi:hypothetical protein